MNKREHLLIEDHLNCVHWTIHNYFIVNESICGLGYEDLYQEGCEALCRAAASYNEEQGAQFHTYAVSVIRNHLRDYCKRTQRQNGSTVSLDEQEVIGGNRVPAAWDDTSGFYVRQVLEFGKRSYSGVARLGIEALELKTVGYTVTDIASDGVELFWENSKPGNQNAFMLWIGKRRLYTSYRSSNILPGPLGSPAFLHGRILSSQQISNFL